MSDKATIHTIIGYIPQHLVSLEDYEGLKAERDALKARLAEAERDAARYRWLRERCYVWSSTESLYREEQEEPVALWLRDSMTLEDVDSTIDAARATDSAPDAQVEIRGETHAPSCNFIVGLPCDCKLAASTTVTVDGVKP